MISALGRGWRLAPRCRDQGSLVVRRGQGIHELDDDFVLTLESGLSFYDNATRARLDAVLSETIELRLSHDVEISMTTAKGNPKWARGGLGRGRPTASLRAIVGAYFRRHDCPVGQAREALKRTQERLELAVRSAGIGLLGLNADAGNVDQLVTGGSTSAIRAHRSVSRPPRTSFIATTSRGSTRAGTHSSPIRSGNSSRNIATSTRWGRTGGL